MKYITVDKYMVILAFKIHITKQTIWWSARFNVLKYTSLL